MPALLPRPQTPTHPPLLPARLPRLRASTGRFVQRPNCVDLQAGEAALRGAGRYSELVALYQSKGRHAAALDLLHALSQHPDSLPAPPQGAAAGARGMREAPPGWSGGRDAAACTRSTHPSAAPGLPTLHLRSQSRGAVHAATRSA